MNYEDLNPLKDAVKNLEEKAYYVVNVSLYKGNVVHKAILYTGFNSGGYRCLLHPNYENVLKDGELIFARIQVISRIANI